MQSAFFKKLLHICQRHNIINILSTDEHHAVLRYGPIGSLLKQNIFNQWLNSHLTNKDVHLFPLEVKSKQNNLQSQTDPSSDSFVKTIVRNYFECLPIIGHNAPFGFATYGSYSNEFTITTPYNDKDFTLKKFLSWDHTSLAFFCSPKKAMNWFHYWSKQRYLWWRKFSSIPSMFTMSEVTKNESGVEQLSLLLRFPWGEERLERISLYEDKMLKSLFQDYHDTSSCQFDEDGVPFLIVCESGLDLAVMTYLFNSFSERWRDGHDKSILQLHYKLAPYKVCIILHCDNTETEKKLRNIANHLSAELRDFGILIFPLVDSKVSTSSENHFINLDEMGVPYAVVLSESSLQTGVIGLRNRDTTLQEQVHIAELTHTLVKYLKIKS